MLTANPKREPLYPPTDPGQLWMLAPTVPEANFSRADAWMFKLVLKIYNGR